MTATTSVAATDHPPACWNPDIGHRLRAVKRLHELTRGAATPGRLTPPQYVVLLAASRLPSVDQRTIGELASIDRATVSAVVQRLIARGLLRATSDPLDGRRKRLSATDEALAMVRNDSVHLREADTRLLERLAPEDRETVIEHLSRIAYSRTVDPSTRAAGERGAHDIFSIAETARALGRLVRICSQLHTAIWRDQAGAFITPVQYTTLDAIIADEPANQNELTTRIDLNKGTVTEIVARLRRDGFVETAQHSDDRRQQVISVTPTGRDILRLAHHAERAVREQLFQPIGENAGRAVDRLLAQILRSE
ncbi:MarR family winged helix-turn-helix transcriptional regulator [Leucobacter allii]|uniref:MarR family winged helix-turn-helix transcriptional regulator n=1 Tax=Leucobacter allii TaxID=2932247 RepID=UPI001FD23834|nr:MarR family winged helix-turn-helix transcriptional regulator [Leucobacter allii]UOR01540.1 MarR family winged helix-turn-helix transcriptional regulator [Leucobacter allii]